MRSIDSYQKGFAAFLNTMDTHDVEGDASLMLLFIIFVKGFKNGKT
jgi:hypothetical protein